MSGPPSLTHAASVDYLINRGLRSQDNSIRNGLPTTLSTPDSHGGVGVEVRFIREIVYPGGHREIDGQTPKQLAPPDAHALPRPTDPIDDTNEGAV
jgi:hypothetical protein